jgi:hypothetical protein
VDDLYKFGFMNPDDQPYQFPSVWAFERTSGGTRLAIAPARDQVDVLLRLIEAMPEPFWLLYVLVVPRGGSESGRYQCPESQTRDAVKGFLHEFRSFLENDGRHHLWIASVSGPAMLVYDRHNLIYGYGPLDEFVTVLSEIGLKESPSVQIPDPHVHHYNEHFDKDEHIVLVHWPWLRTPLRDLDHD